MPKSIGCVNEKKIGNQTLTGILMMRILAFFRASLGWGQTALSITFLMMNFMFVAVAHSESLNTQSSLSLQSESFLSSDYSSTPDRNYFFLGVGLISRPLPTNDTSPQSRDVMNRVGVDFSGRFSPDAPVLSSFNLRELYYQQDQLILGRHLMVWSQGDEDWNLGLFQPQYRWNVLRPTSQSLTGISVNVGEGAGEGWNLVIFGSPFFVPDQGAGYVLTDGRFQNVSPWFQSLPREIRLSGSDVVRRLDYQIQVPQLEKIVFNPGYALRFGFHDHNSPHQLSFALAYKPMNMLSLGVDGWAEYQTRAPVYIEPSVIYHRLAAADYAYRWGDFDFRAGLTSENSDSPRDQKTDLTYATYRPMVVTTTSLGYSARRWGGRLGLIRRQGGETETLGPKAAELADVFSDRLPYRDAVALEGFWNSRPFSGQQLQVGTRWIEGLSETYSLWTLDAKLSLGGEWSVWGDLVLVRAQRTEGHDPRLFTNFENHDSIRTGVTYVF